MKLRLKQIMARYLGHNQTQLPMEEAPIKYKKSGLTEAQALTIKNKIDAALDNDKLYRNNEIGLGQLANYIQEDRYKVSEVINTYYSKNFYSLLNSYRINEAKDLLLSNPLLSVKAVMYEVGFNSKNSFYMAFKRDTGVSPNDFRAMSSFGYQPQLAS